MRVLHVYKDIFPPVAGGIERTIDAIRRAAPDIEHDVLVCSRRRHTIYRSPGPGTSGQEILVAELGRILSTPVAPSFPSWLRRLARGALVHLHAPNPTGELSCLYGLGRSPLVVSHHCDIYRQKALLPVYRQVALRCLERAQAVIAASEALARTSSMLAAYDGPVEIVPYGVDTEAFNPAGVDARRVAALRSRFGNRHVLSVGRLVYYKGFDQLIEAGRHIPWPIVIVGEGPERSNLETHIRSSGLTGRVHLVGRVDDAELRAHLAAASSFVLPSVNRAEAFGISLLEAQAMGLPVIATDVGTGTVDALEPGETGVVIPPRDVSALVHSIRAVMSDVSLMERMGAAAQRWAREKHSLSAMEKSLRSVYEEAWIGYERNGPSWRP